MGELLAAVAAVAAVGTKMAMAKEFLARIRKKLNDFTRLNPEYVGRQFDHAPAKFKDGKSGYKTPAVADAFYTETMQPNVPTLQPGRSRFNNRYFDRDTRRAPLEQHILLSGSDAKLIAGTEEHLSSVSAQTGLEPMPNQPPMPTWMRNVQAIQADAEKHGLPPAAGAPHKFRYSDGGTGFAI